MDAIQEEEIKQIAAQEAYHLIYVTEMVNFSKGALSSKKTLSSLAMHRARNVIYGALGPSLYSMSIVRQVTKQVVEDWLSSDQYKNLQNLL